MPVTRPALPPRYATPEPIASGGMGEVYRATDATLGRTVAVKVLSERWASHDEFHARFLREARTAANLSGEPHVISIYDVSETGDGLPFIVMEYATHGTVGDRLERGAESSPQGSAHRVCRDRWRGPVSSPCEVRGDDNCQDGGVGCQGDCEHRQEVRTRHEDNRQAGGDDDRPHR